MMNIRNLRWTAVFLLTLILPAIACSLTNGVEDEDTPPHNAQIIEVVASTALEPWLKTAVANFNAADIQNSDEERVWVELTAVEAGQAAADMSANSEAAIWIPDDRVWVNLLADQGNAAFQDDCVSTAKSPLVIGMWRPVAESLGWPGLPLGWLDIGSLAGDPSSWAYYSGGEYGDSLRISHAHPGLSGAGTGTLLALVQAAQSKTEAVTAVDIQQPIVQASVGAFEGGVTWFSTGPDLLGQTMAARDPSYLGAGVMYENTIIYYGKGDIVPIYPLEGTFMADFPACINQSADVKTKEAAGLFRDYLLGEEGQTTAVAYGLRTVNTAVAPLTDRDKMHGVDLTQPHIRFPSPSVETVYAIQELWQQERKDVNMVMLLDTSGSMRGSKMVNMRTAAQNFVSKMGDDDTISIIAFETEPQLIVDHARVGDARTKIIHRIEELSAGGDTTLFDAIGDGATQIINTRSVEASNALVVLTDGEDTRSYRYTFDQRLIGLVNEAETAVFTIAYGRDADEETLRALAETANGNFYLGDEASIDAIYEEMSAAFGGAVGVGR